MWEVAKPSEKKVIRRIFTSLRMEDIVKYSLNCKNEWKTSKIGSHPTTRIRKLSIKRTSEISLSDPASDSYVVTFS